MVTEITLLTFTTGKTSNVTDKIKVGTTLQGHSQEPNSWKQNGVLTALARQTCVIAYCN